MYSKKFTIVTLTVAEETKSGITAYTPVCHAYGVRPTAQRIDWQNAPETSKLICCDNT